jgi:hypothetical protein
LLSLLKFVDSKNFKEIAKQDVLDFLNNKRKPESIDPTHKNIGTWNNLQILFLKFLDGYTIVKNQILKEQEYQIV